MKKNDLKSMVLDMWNFPTAKVPMQVLKRGKTVNWHTAVEGSKLLTMIKDYIYNHGSTPHKDLVD